MLAVYDKSKGFQESFDALTVSQYLIDQSKSSPTQTSVGKMYMLSFHGVPLKMRNLLKKIKSGLEGGKLFDPAVDSAVLGAIETGIKGAFVHMVSDGALVQGQKQGRRDQLRAWAQVLALGDGRTGVERQTFQPEAGGNKSLMTVLSQSKEELKGLGDADVFTKMRALVQSFMPTNYQGDTEFRELTTTAASTAKFPTPGAMRSWHANELGCIPDANFELNQLSSLTPGEALYCIYILLFKKLPNNMAERAAQGGVTCLIEFTGGGFDSAAADGRFVVRWRTPRGYYFTPHYTAYATQFNAAGVCPYIKIGG